MFGLEPLKVVIITCGALNSLNAELNSICHMLALLGAHPILHVSWIRVCYDDAFDTFNP
jgi:hypothetical protein